MIIKVLNSIPKFQQGYIGLEASYVLTFTICILLHIKLFVIARDISKIKNLSNFINLNEYTVNIIDKSEYMHTTCSLA